MIFNRVRIVLLGLIPLIFIPFIVHSQKNDTVYLLNGDRITGEVKKFEYGLLTLKTDAMQTITIEYDRIMTVYSAKYFEIRYSIGDRVYGSLGKSHVPGIINIIITPDTIPKPIIDIVQITTIKKSFLKKLDGSVDLGLNYTKASDVFQYNLAATVTYRAPKYSTNFNLSSIFTDQRDLEVTRKNDIGLNGTRFLPKNWFTGFEVKGQQNTELDLQLRLQFGYGAGYDLIRTNSNRLYSTAGLAINTEKTIDSAYASKNVEGFLSMQYKWFQYRHPKIDVTSGFNYYPSFTVWGRSRLEYDLSAKIEIIKDLFLGVSLYDNFDSRPSGGGTSKNDWGIITSIGYTF